MMTLPERLCAALLCAVCCTVAIATKDNSPPRIIVQLEDPPASLRSRADRMSAARTIQDRFLGAVKRHGFELSQWMNHRGDLVDSRFSEVMNAVSIVATEGSDVDALVAQIRQRPGVVGAWANRPVVPNLVTSLDQVNIPQAWLELQKATGIAKPGKGIKFASVDGGATIKNPLLNGAGFDWPDEIPAPGLGETANCNGKVIVARAYFSPYDPPAEGENHSWLATTARTSHGMHTSSTVTGVPVSVEINGESRNMSGLAPYAWMMIYRVLYPNRAGSETGQMTEILAAWEDAVKDGAQVISNSWGSGALRDSRDFIAAFAEKATKEKGILFVFSAGNDGSNLGTVDHSGTASIMRVGAITGPKNTNWAIVTTPSLQPNYTIGTFAVTTYAGSIQPNVSLAFNKFPLVFLDNATLACSTLSAGSYSGNAVILQGASIGGCAYATKVANLYAAGAKVVVLISTSSSTTLSSTYAPVVTVLSVGNTGGNILADFAKSNSGVLIHLSIYLVASSKDRMAYFSSCGPTVDMNIGVDVVAPGVSIVAGGYDISAPIVHYGYGFTTGTSMSCPHVSGAAILILQLHPQFSPAEIKSAITTTANLSVASIDGTTMATPLQMGSGRLDVVRALDPSLFMQPTTFEISIVNVDDTRAVSVTVTSYKNLTNLTVSLSAIDGFPGVDEPFTVSPQTIASLLQGESTTITVTFQGSNITQDWFSYVIIRDSNNIDIAHAPVWARTIARETFQIALLDVDGSDCNSSAPDLSSVYKSAFESAGFTTKVFGNANTVCNGTFVWPSELRWGTYEALVVFTGGYGTGRPSLSTYRSEITTIVMRGNASLITAGQSVDTLWSSVKKTPAQYLCGTTFNSTMTSVATLYPHSKAPGFISNVTTLPSAVKAPGLTGDGKAQEIPLLASNDFSKLYAKAYVNQEIPLELGFHHSCAVLSVGFESFSTSDRTILINSLMAVLKQKSPNSTSVVATQSQLTGTLSVQVKDPSFSVTSISVVWGDSKANDIHSYNTTDMIAHTYQTAGVYVPTVMVTSSLGRVFMLKHSASFNITEQTVSSSSTVASSSVTAEISVVSSSALSSGEPAASTVMSVAGMSSMDGHTSSDNGAEAVSSVSSSELHDSSVKAVTESSGVPPTPSGSASVVGLSAIRLACLLLLFSL